MQYTYHKILHEGLLGAAQVPDEALRQPVEREWSIAGIMNHCSQAEWWYLDRLSLAPLVEAQPVHWHDRLAPAHRQLVVVLPKLEGVARTEFKNCELWLPHKILRRALWHGRDHTQHSYEFRARFGI